jgi:hypothetical protein
MKKIYIFFALFLLTFSTSFSFADDRHDAIINHYKVTYPQYFYTFDELLNINEDLNNAYLVLKGQELRDKNNRINALLQNSPNIHIILDVEEGDGLVASGSLSLGQNLVQYVRRLTITNVAQDIRIIGNNFLRNSSGLTELNLPFLSQVKRVGDNFLRGCNRLTYLDLAPLSQVTEIGNEFLMDCSGLTYLDLAPLSQVTKIGDAFLYGCSGLVYLGRFSLSQLTHIGSYFFWGCNGLIYLDLSFLSQATKIGTFFLGHCTSLTTFEQIRLSAYNRTLRASLDVTFPQDTIIGNAIRENYIEHVPVRKPTKSTRK